MNGRLAGRSVVVTGGASGLGRAIASRFADEGALVVVGDLREAPREGGDPIAEVLGDRGVFLSADASSAGQVRILPGAIAFTTMPSGPKSTATWRVRLTTPPLAVQ